MFIHIFRDNKINIQVFRNRIVFKKLQFFSILYIISVTLITLIEINIHVPYRKPCWN